MASTTSSGMRQSITSSSPFKILSARSSPSRPAIVLTREPDGSDANVVMVAPRLQARHGDVADDPPDASRIGRRCRDSDKPRGVIVMNLAIGNALR